MASLSKDISLVWVSRLIENMVCLKSDTSDVSRSRREPPCSSPNAVRSSPVYIIRRPNIIPESKFSSFSDMVIVRSFGRYGFPGDFSIIMSCTVFHLSGTKLKRIAFVMRVLWYVNILSEMRCLSEGSICFSNFMIAFACPRCRFDGDVVVFSPHFLNPDRTSAVDMVSSIESFGAILLHAFRMIFVASVVGIESISKLPSKIFWLSMDVANGPSIFVISGWVKGVPSAWEK